MRRFAWLFAALTGTLGVLAGGIILTALPASAQGVSGGQAAADMTVSVSTADVSTRTGDTFTFTSEISNSGPDATPPLIAHFNIVSLDQAVYVDPEDWSPQRTARVAPIAPGSSATQSWTVNPILKGEFALYVVVLPDSPMLATASSPTASPAIYVRVDQQRTLNPGGVLPVVIVVPGVLALAFAGLRVARGRI